MNGVFMVMSNQATDQYLKNRTDLTHEEIPGVQRVKNHMLARSWSYATGPDDLKQP